jgi:protein-tyrosine-phosphatase
MREAGVDISGQSSKLVNTLADVPLDLVITVCGHADENCPAFLGKSKWDSMVDPNKFDVGSHEIINGLPIRPKNLRAPFIREKSAGRRRELRDLQLVVACTPTLSWSTDLL